MTAIEIYAKSEAFIGKDGDIEFDHTKTIFRSGDEYFFARSPLRHTHSAADLSKLSLQKIPVEDVWPHMEARFSEAPHSLPPDCYIKRPSLLFFGDSPASQQPAKQILCEVEACEVLRRHPHPNIAQYFGCLSKDCTIIGLCFKKYATTLDKILKDKPAGFDKDNCLQGIRSGLEHMHKLGLVHNDINPRNIMMDGETPVIIDFDSCKKQGEPLGLKGGTMRWEKEDAKFALPENDEYDVAKIEESFLQWSGRTS